MVRRTDPKLAWTARNLLLQVYTPGVVRFGPGNESWTEQRDHGPVKRHAEESRRAGGYNPPRRRGATAGDRQAIERVDCRAGHQRAFRIPCRLKSLGQEHATTVACIANPLPATSQPRNPGSAEGVRKKKSKI